MNDEAVITDPLISVASAARRIGISPAAAYARIERTGELHPRISQVHRVGARLLVSEYEVEEIEHRR